MRRAERTGYRSIPKSAVGGPHIRGTRVRVCDILDLLASGLQPKDILADYPYLDESDVRAALAYGAASSSHRGIVVSWSSGKVVRGQPAGGSRLSSPALFSPDSDHPSLLFGTGEAAVTGEFAGQPVQQFGRHRRGLAELEIDMHGSSSVVADRYPFPRGRGGESSAGGVRLVEELGRAGHFVAVDEFGEIERVRLDRECRTVRPSR